MLYQEGGGICANSTVCFNLYVFKSICAVLVPTMALGMGMQCFPIISETGWAIGLNLV